MSKSKLILIITELAVLIAFIVALTVTDGWHGLIYVAIGIISGLFVANRTNYGR